MLRLQIIVGSTREGRHADAVLRWLAPVAKAHPAFETEVLDLREWPLPIFQEVITKMGDLKNPTYSDPMVGKWNAKIKEADAYLFVTPEYNHGVPGVLKNAIDSVFMSWGFRHKPVAFVSYSNGIAGGVRAIEQLNQIMLEAEAVPVRTPTIIPNVTTGAFDANGKPASPTVEATALVMLEDLAWLGNALKPARASEPPPPTFRVRALVAKAGAPLAR